MIASEFKKNVLSRFKKVIKPNATLPECSLVKFYDGTMVGNDLRMELHYSDKANFANIEGLFDFDKIFKIITKLKKHEFTFSQDKKGALKITSKIGTFSILQSKVETDDFPVLTSGTSEFLGSVKTDHFEKMQIAEKYTMVIDKALGPPVRVYSNNILLDTDGNIVSTNAEILACYPSDLELEKQVFIAKEAFPLLDSEFSVYHFENPKAFAFAFGHFVLYTRDPDINYPNYRAIYPKELPYNVTFGVEGFAETVELSKLTNERLLKLGVGEGKLKIESQNLDDQTMFTQEIEAKKMDDIAMEIGLSPSLLIDYLKADQPEELAIDFSGPDRAIVINKYTLLMPLTLQD